MTKNDVGKIFKISTPAKFRYKKLWKRCKFSENENDNVQNSTKKCDKHAKKGEKYAEFAKTSKNVPKIVKNVQK